MWKFIVFILLLIVIPTSVHAATVEVLEVNNNHYGYKGKVRFKFDQGDMDIYARVLIPNSTRYVVVPIAYLQDYMTTKEGTLWISYPANGSISFYASTAPSKSYEVVPKLLYDKKKVGQPFNPLKK